MDGLADEAAAGGAAEESAELNALDRLWRELVTGLATFLSLMTDPDEGDHLLVEIPDADPDGEGFPPYAQFAAFGDGLMVRAEISGNAFLLPQYQLDEAGCDYLEGSGWAGNEADAAGERNWYVETSIADVYEVAQQVIDVLRFHFGIAHPQLLTYNAWGPAASEAFVLGLCATADVPIDEPQAPTPRRMAGDRPKKKVMKAVTPANRDELLELVGQTLAPRCEDEPDIDDDGDFVLEHMGQPVWVRVRHDTPTVEIMVRVAHDVYSERDTAVEIGLLNRDHPWVRWTLRDRAIWQTVVIPGMPFVPRHLGDLLEVFLKTMTATRDDLVLRTRAKVG